MFVNIMRSVCPFAPMIDWCDLLRTQRRGSSWCSNPSLKAGVTYVAVISLISCNAQGYTKPELTFKFRY
jgi:hypothetical protein